MTFSFFFPLAILSASFTIVAMPINHLRNPGLPPVHLQNEPPLYKYPHTASDITNKVHDSTENQKRNPTDDGYIADDYPTHDNERDAHREIHHPQPPVRLVQTHDEPVQKYEKPTSNRPSKSQMLQRSLSRIPFVKAIQPALGAVFSQEKPKPLIPARAISNHVEYKSAPLRGTEGRDFREARHPNSFQRGPDAPIPPGNPRNNIRSGRNAYPTEHQPDEQPVKKKLPRHDEVQPLAPEKLEDLDLKERNPPTYSSADMLSAREQWNPSSKDPVEQFSKMQPESPRSENVRVSEPYRRKSTNLWNLFVSGFRSTINSIRHSNITPSPSPSSVFEADNYTEEDVQSLVNDIIREIQMRKEELPAHGEMLEKTNRWKPDDLTDREKENGVYTGPLLYMQTKLLVRQESVMDAVMTSAKRMMSTRKNPLSWSATSRLLTEVQDKLSTVLQPVKAPKVERKIKL